mmetsp:Transcript_40730/g.77782  ORF Transcript_40730/g.77782 Transcript_40730/m.77782 type:complete len:145 (-) Transcript_40730:1414-1848(-)
MGRGAPARRAEVELHRGKQMAGPKGRATSHLQEADVSLSVSREVQGQVEGQTEGEETRLDQPESLYPNEFGNPLKGEVLWEEVVEEGDQSLQWKVRPPLVSFVWVDLELDLIGQEWRRGLGQQQWLPAGALQSQWGAWGEEQEL